MAPWLAEKCEAKEMSVRAAEKFVESKLGKPVQKGSAARSQKVEKEEEAVA